MILMNILPRVLVGLVAAALLSGCGAVGNTGDGPKIVAAFYPLQYVAQRVAGDHAQVQSLANPGAEPHDLELTIAQTAAVADADVIVLSTGFQPAVDATVEQNAEGHVVDAADVADLRTPSGEPDPHFWLDPTRLARVAAEVEQALAEADPEHAADYESDLAALQRDLGALDKEFTAGLADCERNTIVVSHDAFGYLADRYGLDVEAISGISPDAEPSPAHLRQLSGLVRERGITTVFTERLDSADMAQTLAGDLGLKTAVLDPVEGLTDATADEDYLSLMRANLAALEDANGCR
jgi:zinc transport system substrate-binding protein